VLFAGFRASLSGKAHPAEFTAFIAAESKKYALIIKRAEVKLD